MRIATYNIKNALDLDRGRASNSGLAEACKTLDVDVLGMQEVDARRFRSFLRNQPRVARRGGEFATSVYGRTMREGLFGAYGNALLVRGDISEVERFKLPGTPGHEPRGAILATVEVGKIRCSVAVTHLQNRRKIWDDKLLESPEQLRAVLAALRTREGPRILMGDFNLYASIASPIIKAAGFVEVKHANTFPVDKPDRSIDYIALDGLHAVDVDVIRLPVGDHRAVVVEVAAGAKRLSSAKRRPADERPVPSRAPKRKAAPAKKKAAAKRKAAPTKKKSAKRR
jgi:endonuclease/exonuclease/phosphatase family metal-dependent hydrolase